RRNEKAPRFGVARMGALGRRNARWRERSTTAGITGPIPLAPELVCRSKEILIQHRSRTLRYASGGIRPFARGWTGAAGRRSGNGPAPGRNPARLIRLVLFDLVMAQRTRPRRCR